MSVKVRVAACTRIFRNARTDGTRRRGAGTFGGTGDFPGITLDLFNWVHGQRCAGGFAKLMVGGAAHRRYRPAHLQGTAVGLILPMLTRART